MMRRYLTAPSFWAIRAHKSRDALNSKGYHHRCVSTSGHKGNVDDEDFVVHSPLPSLGTKFDSYTIPEFIWSNLHLKEKRIAFECSLTGQKMTFRQVYEQSRSFAAALIQAGLKRGDVVSIVLPNVIQFASIVLGVLEAGGTVSPANPAYTADEIIRQVAVSSAKFVVTVPAYLSTIRTAAKKCPTLRSIILVGETSESEDGCHSFSEMIKVDPTGFEFTKGTDINTGDAVGILPFSSGTTGPPKGVQLTHRNVVTNVQQFLARGSAFVHSVHRGEEQDRLIGILPFFHSYGLCAIILCGLCAGNHTLCVPKFGTDTFLANLRQAKANVLTLAPPLIQFLVHHPQVTSKDFEILRCIQTGAAPLGVGLIAQLKEKAGRELFVQNMYGLTETSPGAIILNPKYGNSKIGSCGNPIPDTSVKVVDIETGQSLGPNQKGEICIRGPQVMKGYYRDEEATQNTIKNGWLFSGDIGYYDEDNCFYVVDRIKELIKVNGLQVAPAELEDLIRHHEGVSDVAIIGIPDDRCGELPRAYIVKKLPTLTDIDIHGFLIGKIAKHKEIRGGVVFVESIPKAPSGKILRRQLKQDYLSKLKS